MSRDALSDYVTKTKFSRSQYALIDYAIERNIDISVHGCYSGWINDFIHHYEFTLVGEPLVRSYDSHYTRPKQYNCYRPVVFEVTRKDGRSEVIVMVFPSHEYVQQYAELVATYVAIKNERRARTYGKPIKCRHYPTMENTLADWSGLKSGLAKLDSEPSVAIMGEIPLLLSCLEKLDFSHPLPVVSVGIDDIFGLHILEDRHRERRLYLLGAKHSYWGSAAGQIAACLAEAGAKHIIYAAKAGTFISTQKIHKIFMPNNYLLLCENPSDPGAPDLDSFVVESPIRDLRGFMNEIRTGWHLTVPTVVGETQQQREKYASYGPTTIDNEISFIARAISRINHEDGRRVDFTPLHFITDYLYEPSESKALTAGDLSVKSKQYYDIKRERFMQIAKIISTYAALADTTLIRHPDSGRHWQYTIIDILQQWTECKTLLASEEPAAFARETLTRFLLRSRYAAYYNGDIAWGLSTMEHICDSMSNWKPSLKALSSGFNIIKEYHQLAPRRSGLSDLDTRKLKSVATRAGELIRDLDDSYARYVMAVTQVQALLRYCWNVQVERRKQIIATLSKICIEARRYLVESKLSKADESFEELHLDRLRAYVDIVNEQPSDAITKFEHILSGWESLLERHEGQEVDWILYAEIALTKDEMLNLGFRPLKVKGWLADVTEAKRKAVARFDMLERLRRALIRVESSFPKMGAED